jgi:hypothetical protein
MLLNNPRLSVLTTGVKFIIVCARGCSMQSNAVEEMSGSMSKMFFFIE